MSEQQPARAAIPTVRSARLPGLRAFVPPCLCACLLGCSNPLASSEEDYGAPLSPERLREIDTAKLERFRKLKSEKTPADDDPAAAARKRFEGLASYDLTLEQARASVLENNLELKVAIIDPAIAAQRLSEEEAAFEAAFTLRSLWSETDAPTATELEGSQAKFGSLEPGVRIPLRTGGTARVTLPVARNETNNDFATLNPAYTSDLEFSISQPLLRNAGRRAATQGIRIASYNRRISEAQTKLEVIRQLAAVDRAYWRVYAARRALDVSQQQYELAVDQLGRAERRVRAGAVGEIEVIRAQAGVSDQLGAILLAQNAILTQQRELKRIVNLPGLTVDTDVMITLKTDPDPVEYQFDRRELTQSAVDNRMEMLELELRLAADAATIAFNKNQALPLFTLDYTYRINGLGASGQDSFRMLERNKFEDWSLGLGAEVPLGNEEANSRIRQSILTRLQRLNTKQARELAIRQEVLNAMDTLDADWQRILAARQSVILNTRALQAEQRQFDVGASTSTDVLDAAARLAEAQLQEIRSVTDYQIAQIDLAFATGTLLGAERVQWGPAPAPDKNEPTPPETLSPPWNEAPESAPGPAMEVSPPPAPREAEQERAKEAEQVPPEPAKPEPESPK
ncbi:MAG: TolC family protein [Phycisphaerales bacterium]|nr:TolC family protein [Phycisphaerales bacterium]